MCPASGTFLLRSPTVSGTIYGTSLLTHTHTHSKREKELLQMFFGQTRFFASEDCFLIPGKEIANCLKGDTMTKGTKAPLC